MIKQKYDLHNKLALILPKLFVKWPTNQIHLINNNYQILNFTKPSLTIITSNIKQFFS